MGLLGIVFMIFAFIAAISLYRFVALAKALQNEKKGKKVTIIDTGGAGLHDLVDEGRIEEAVDVYATFMGVDEFMARKAVEKLKGQSDVIHDNFLSGWDCTHTIIFPYLSS